ncbi:osmoprotectant transport system ATP-binding protein [Pedobacter cryoconitis]|uniref:Osmoprotectant transport system ATP-binding protein n=1 Tax=Pedobacter cryoconitis TaxID=188932 RepID=A0A7W8ZJ45_9SPHI|nr:ATP-binding cassette domain-containing protein [Pedobacter cryoconitis]MBB5634893.1 osmoprotectant transport system ATP-binding protein [Pedobacter cryoconitis]
MIKAENLIRKFGSLVAVNDISFEVKEGENLILLGTSGCGKTTTLRMINRLIEPDSGTVFIDGVDVRTRQPEELRRGIGYVLQNHGLFPHYTVAENIAIVPRLLKWQPTDIRKRADELFHKLNLDPVLADKYPAALSGGQQQRVGLARSLMVNPPVLLMDEPFGALDNLTRISIRKEFKALDELVKKTVIMVTHDVQEAFEMGDRICLMDQGQIKQIGTPEELLFYPANDFVADFFKEQRLQLELKSVLVCELLPEYSDRTVSVWERMEQLLQRDVPEGSAIEDLMSAFSAYKKQ